MEFGTFLEERIGLYVACFDTIPTWPTFKLVEGFSFEKLGEKE